MPRFVVLTHDHPHLHWDLLLEADGALRTWRLEMPPAPAAEIRAEALPDHRLMYLTYEGPVSGNRGRVDRWDAGSYEIVCWNAQRIELMLSGERIQGLIVITQFKGTDWRFTWLDR